VALIIFSNRFAESAAAAGSGDSRGREPPPSLCFAEHYLWKHVAFRRGT